MAAFLYPITENSWFIKEKDNTIIGILYALGEDGYMIANKQAKIFYENMEKVEADIGKIKISERKVKRVEDTVNGYPVKHDDIEVVNEDPPIYYKRNGKTEFVAGYWGIQFKNGWTPAFCPKASTILTNNAEGPFKNRLEMLNRIASLNSQNNLTGEQ